MLDWLVFVRKEIKLYRRNPESCYYCYMLNPFPIQFLALFAYFLLRLFVGSVLIYLALSHHKHREELKDILTFSWFSYGRFVTTSVIVGEFIIGSLLIAGAYTQYAALAVMALCFKMIIMRNWFAHSSFPSRLFYFLLLGTSLSLFITGAGALAFDLPI